MSEGLERQEFTLPQTFYIYFNDIDPEHEGLVEVINGCVPRLVDGILEEFEEPFEEFVARLVGHFRNEESHMRALGYDGLEWHAGHHAECLERVHELIRGMRSRGYAGMQDLRVCFHDIIYDIAHADLQFGEFVENLGLTQRRR